ncbi:MAG: gamma-glutamyl-gamma-aminobutyrate hydrolase family protein [Flavobacteriales bacterium]|nr:gamma-glutamyl-gamma-aminobutyrate hydrolase family protein [Flavobacteriales bacterium]
MKRLFSVFIIPYLLISSIIISCGEPSTIILSKASQNYVDWIADDNTVILDAYRISNTDSILALADGIIITGGEDINPLLYNDTSNLKVCGDIDHRRDTLEKKLFDYAFENKIPLIGVCRGMQMINVASGGSLYGDIPSEIGTEVIHRNNGEVMHEIALTESCPLIFPEEQDTFMVNSWHHQGLKNIPDGINVVARSFDGLPEAIYIDEKLHPFMIAVQFHPERLGSDNPIHKRMRKSFLNAVKLDH